MCLLNVISLEEFTNLPQEKQIMVLDEMKETLGVSGILEAWGLTRSRYYYLLKKFNLSDGNKKQKVQANPVEPATQIENDTPIQERKELAVLADRAADGMSFSLTVQGPAKLISQILNSIAETYSTKENKYKINVSVEEA